MTSRASLGIATVMSLRLCSRAPVTTISACLLTISSVGKPRTERSNTRSPPFALCGELGIGSGFGPPPGGAPDDQLGAVGRHAGARPLRGPAAAVGVLDLDLGPRDGRGGARAPARAVGHRRTDRRPRRRLQPR